MLDFLFSFFKIVSMEAFLGVDVNKQQFSGEVLAAEMVTCHSLLGINDEVLP